jgi:hypothetical protein
MAHFRLKQKNHTAEGPYYRTAGTYFGFKFDIVGDELVAEGDPDDFKSLVDAKKVFKLSVNALKELKEAE